MSIKYKIKQFKQRGSDWNGCYYARVAITDVMTLKDVGEAIQASCSLKQSDVNGVLTELIEVVKAAIQDSKAVRLDGLGTIKPGIRSRMSTLVSEVDNSDIKGFKVTFEPAYTLDKERHRTYALLDGASVQKYKEYEDGVNDNARGK